MRRLLFLGLLAALPGQPSAAQDGDAPMVRLPASLDQVLHCPPDSAAMRLFRTPLEIMVCHGTPAPPIRTCILEPCFLVPPVEGVGQVPMPAPGTAPPVGLEMQTVALITDFGRVVCSGTSIGQNAVLTAAHCFCNASGQVPTRVFFGDAVSKGDAPHGDAAGEYRASFAISHHVEFGDFCARPDYQRAVMPDLAVVTFFAEDAPAGHLSARLDTAADAKAAQSVWIAGFGETERNWDGGRLIMAQMPLPDDCPSGPLCTTAPTFTLSSSDYRDTCNIDSGGPVMTPDGGLLGVTRRGSGMRTPGGYSCGMGGVYTRLDATIPGEDHVTLRDWVMSLIAPASLGLDEEMIHWPAMGHAPVGDDPDGDRAVIRANLVWSRVRGLTDANGVTRLGVCYYSNPPSGGHRVGLAPADLDRAVARIALLTRQWEGAKTLLRTGEFRRGGLEFIHHHADGRVRLCEETESSSQIRVAFNQQPAKGGKWSGYGLSAIGTSGYPRARGTPTLHLPTPNTIQWSVIDYVVLHEFGHAIGFEHEMAHIGWNACRSRFDPGKFVDMHHGRPFPGEAKDRRSQEAAARAAFKEMARGSWVTERVDKESIMAYKLAGVFTPPHSDCEFHAQPNRLSPGDQALVTEFYPRRP